VSTVLDVATTDRVMSSIQLTTASEIDVARVPKMALEEGTPPALVTAKVTRLSMMLVIESVNFTQLGLLARIEAKDVVLLKGVALATRSACVNAVENVPNRAFKLVI